MRHRFIFRGMQLQCTRKRIFPGWKWFGEIRRQVEGGRHWLHIERHVRRCCVALLGISFSAQARLSTCYKVLIIMKRDRTISLFRERLFTVSDA